jgi:hypothetical protein
MKTSLLTALLLGVTSIASADVTLIDNDATMSVDCAKDPAVSLIGNHLTVTLTGTCTKLTITGNHETVTGSAVSVWISGNHNTAALDAVDKLTLAGNHNTVTYKRTVDAKLKRPRISSPGIKNTITRRN